MTAFWLSIALAISGCVGLLLAGKGKWYGWAIGAATQPVWVVFAIVTKGYGIIATAVMYFIVYTTNVRKALQR